jgi:nitroreductase
MSLNALLRKRRNVYGFLPKPVSDELLSGILEDAIRVPSAGFTQDFDLVVVRDRSTKKRLAEASREEEYVKSNLALGFYHDSSSRHRSMCEQAKI